MATLDQAARDLIESGALAHLVTINADGSPQVSVVWVGLDGDELVAGHLDGRQRKLQNIRHDPRVTLPFEGTGDNGIGMRDHLVLQGRLGSPRAARPTSCTDSPSHPSGRAPTSRRCPSPRPASSATSRSPESAAAGRGRDLTPIRPLSWVRRGSDPAVRRGRRDRGPGRTRARPARPTRSPPAPRPATGSAATRPARPAPAPSGPTAPAARQPRPPRPRPGDGRRPDRAQAGPARRRAPPGVQLGQPPAEPARRVEQTHRQPGRLLGEPLAGQPQRDDRRVVGPDRPAVVGQRRVAAGRRRHGAHPKPLSRSAPANRPATRAASSGESSPVPSK